METHSTLKSVILTTINTKLTIMLVHNNMVVKQVVENDTKNRQIVVPTSISCLRISTSSR